MNFNQQLFKAKLFHGLKSRQTEYETLAPRFLEVVICECLGFKHVGDSTYYADGIKDDTQISIKTRMLHPVILKRKPSKDFHTNFSHFLGQHQISKSNEVIVNGIEVVQRRQQISTDNDSTADPLEIGRETLNGFRQNIIESSEKFNTPVSKEVIMVHGYNKHLTHYITTVFWDDCKLLSADQLNWSREKNSVVGIKTVDGRHYKVCERINGNANREATCFKEYKDVASYPNRINISVPVPNPHSFNEEDVVKEMNNLESELSMKFIDSLVF